MSIIHAIDSTPEFRSLACETAKATPSEGAVRLIEFHSAPTARRGQSPNRLSPRERQVAEMAYLSNRDIAMALEIGLPTVKTLISRGLEKTGAANRTELALIVERAERAA